jgi:hypothetical protein
MNNLHIVTVATDSEFYLKYLVESCSRNGRQIKILGYGKKWKGFAWKFNLMIKYLKSINEDDIVCFVDGYDVICNRNLDELKLQFIEYKNKYNFKIIVGIDIYKFKLQELIAGVYFNNCKSNLLNSGTYIGYAKDLYDILFKAYNLDPSDKNDDQILLTKYCKMHPNDIFFDKNQDFFLTIHKSFFEISNELDIHNNEAYYKSKKPFFIHGPSCTYLNSLLINLNYDISNDGEFIKNTMKKKFFYKSIHYFKELVIRYLLIIIFILLVVIKFNMSTTKLINDKLKNI